MKHLVTLLTLFVLTSFTRIAPKDPYLFIMLRPIPSCEGKCNNFELLEYPKKNAEDCKKQEDSCKTKYGTTATYYTVGPGEGVIFYKYTKFVQYCDCKVLGVHKSSSVAAATEEMNKKVAEERIKKPKAYHNYEIYKTWPN